MLCLWLVLCLSSDGNPALVLCICCDNCPDISISTPQCSANSVLYWRVRSLCQLRCHAYPAVKAIAHPSIPKWQVGDLKQLLPTVVWSLSQAELISKRDGMLLVRALKILSLSSVCTCIVTLNSRLNIHSPSKYHPCWRCGGFKTQKAYLICPGSLSQLGLAEISNHLVIPV